MVEGYRVDTGALPGQFQREDISGGNSSSDGFRTEGFRISIARNDWIFRVPRNPIG